MKKVLISCWNVNSVNARLEHLLKFLSEKSPDIMLLQELKCVEEKFPYEAIEEKGYNCAVYGQKSYNGVAILSKSPLEDITKGLQDYIIKPSNQSTALSPLHAKSTAFSGSITNEVSETTNQQARYIEAVTTINGCVLRIASVYVPNGQEVGSEKFTYKLSFFDQLQNHLSNVLKNEEIFIIGGDYNVAPDEIDVFDPKSLDGEVGFHPDERAKYKTLLNTGFFDAFRLANPDQKQFSWWDYRAGSWQHNKGMRIDHFLISPEAADIMHLCVVESEYRALEKTSDHAPITIILNS